MKPTARSRTNSDGKAIVMIYMCKTYLESSGGMATAYIKEIAAAKNLDNGNAIIKTGSCSKWQKRTVSSNKNQIWQMQPGGQSVLTPV